MPSIHYATFTTQPITMYLHIRILWCYELLLLLLRISRFLFTMPRSIKLCHRMFLFGVEQPREALFCSAPSFLLLNRDYRAKFYICSEVYVAVLIIFSSLNTIVILFHFTRFFFFWPCFHPWKTLHFQHAFPYFVISIVDHLHWNNCRVASFQRISPKHMHTLSNADTQIKQLIDLPRILKLTTELSVKEFKWMRDIKGEEKAILQVKHYTVFPYCILLLNIFSKFQWKNQTRQHTNKNERRNILC